MDIEPFLRGLGDLTAWIVAHWQFAIGVLVALILLAYLTSGRASR